VFLTAEPLVMEPSQEEMEKAICNLKTNKAPGEYDITAQLIRNASRELTLCRSNLKPYCMGRKAAFFSVGI